MSDESGHSAEYQQALHKSVTPLEPSLPVNVGTTEARKERVKREIYVRDHLSSIKGLSFYERMIFVRENLFDTNVRGDPPSQVRNRGLGDGTYPEGYFPETAYPNYIKLIDELDTHIKSLPIEQQPEASIRLSSIIYGIGIALHPFMDANAQSLRLVSLSYIHEYNPQSKDKFFNLRASEDDENPIKFNFIPHVMDSVGYLENDEIFEGSKTQKFVGYAVNMLKSPESRNQVLEIYKGYLTNGNYDTDKTKNKWTRSILGEAFKMYNEIGVEIKSNLKPIITN